jgi:hypothetical protein
MHISDPKGILRNKAFALSVEFLTVKSKETKRESALGSLLKIKLRMNLILQNVAILSLTSLAIFDQNLSMSELVDTSLRRKFENSLTSACFKNCDSGSIPVGVLHGSVVVE